MIVIPAGLVILLSVVALFGRKAAANLFGALCFIVLAVIWLA